MKTHTVCLTFDFDAICVWLANYPPTPARFSRGEYGATVGVPRILSLLRKYGISATFFIPGHTIESFPDTIDNILAAGHEIGHHGYAHEDPSQQTPAQERESMEQGLEVIKKYTGQIPIGYRSPSWDYSLETLKILVEKGFRYDSSLFGDDFHPYHPRLGDQVTLRAPLQKGTEVDLWEIPVDFCLDDWPHFTFDFNSPRPGLSAPSKVFEIWKGELDFFLEYESNGVFTLTTHPQVIGRGHRLLLLDQFVRYALNHDKVEFSRLGDYVLNL